MRRLSIVLAAAVISSGAIAAAREVGDGFPAERVVLGQASLLDPDAVQSDPDVNSAIREIGWDETAASLRSERKDYFDFICPPIADASGFSVWGTNIYTDSSSICAAAVHFGEITLNGGAVRIVRLDGLEAYAGTTRNGIVSLDSAAWFFSYRFAFRQ